MPSKKRSTSSVSVGIQVTEAPDLEALAAAQDARDGDDALLLVGEEFAAGALAAQGEHGLRDLLVGEVAEVVNAAAQRDVRMVSMSKTRQFMGWPCCARWRRSCRGRRGGSHQHGDCHDQARFIGQSDVPSPMPSPCRLARPRSENTTSGFAHEFCTTPTSRIQTPWAKPVPMALTIASFRGEAHGQKTRGPLGFSKLHLLGGHEEVLDEACAEALQGLVNALCFEDVDADAKNHSRAATMRAFISRTATVRPSNTARR